MRPNRVRLSRVAATAMLSVVTVILSGCGDTGNAANTAVLPGSVLNKAPSGPASIQLVAAKYAANDHSNKRKPPAYYFTVPILEYHDIRYVPHNPWTMDPQQFAEEMKFLAVNKFTPITLDQLNDTARHGKPLPSRPIVITFDDGYVSNYTNAFPILKKYGFHATIFMVSGAVGHNGMLTVDELKEMEASGLVKIESHTVHHKNLTKIPDAQALSELVNSKKQLQQLLGQPVLYFCYPEGGWNARVVKNVMKAGYLLATTTKQGYASSADTPLLLKRIAIHEDVTMKQFAKLLSRSLPHGPVPGSDDGIYQDGTSGADNTTNGVNTANGTGSNNASNSVS